MREQHASVKEELWNDEMSESFSNEDYHKLLLGQYGIYVEMADRVNARRSLVLTFFLVVHAGILSGLGFALLHAPNIKVKSMLLFPLIGFLMLCYAWWRIVQYYRRISRAKNRVIAELETRLPANPSWLAEQKAMGSDRPYSHLKRMEVTLPFVFAGLYIFAYIFAAFLM